MGWRPISFDSNSALPRGCEPQSVSVKGENYSTTQKSSLRRHLNRFIRHPILQPHRMKRSLIPSFCACTLGLLLSPTNSQAAAINFDTLGDFTNNFSIALNSDAGKTNGLSESSGSGGILGS